MEASFVEEVSGGSESVPRGASRALIGVIAGRRRRGPPPSLIEPTRHIGHIVLAFGRPADVTFTGVTIRHPGYPWWWRHGYLDHEGRAHPTGIGLRRLHRHVVREEERGRPEGGPVKLATAEELIRAGQRR
jgi:hypothetical protein